MLSSIIRSLSLQVYKLEKKAQNTVLQMLVPQASVESVLQQGAFRMLASSASVPHALSVCLHHGF